ncbi:MAG: DUF202 domain-containing protein [Marmoricola sp.]
MTGARPPSLPTERTALAWQRTALSLVAGAAALSRLTYHWLGMWSLACLLVALPFGVWVIARSRPGDGPEASTRRPRLRHDGIAGACLVAMTVVLGTTELVALTLR